jgi:hypothetical protein
VHGLKPAAMLTAATDGRGMLEVPWQGGCHMKLMQRAMCPVCGCAQRHMCACILHWC